MTVPSSIDRVLEWLERIHAARAAVAGVVMAVIVTPAVLGYQLGVGVDRWRGEMRMIAAHEAEERIAPLQAQLRMHSQRLDDQDTRLRELQRTLDRIAQQQHDTAADVKTVLDVLLRRRPR